MSVAYGPLPQINI